MLSTIIDSTQSQLSVRRAQLELMIVDNPSKCVLADKSVTQELYYHSVVRDCHFLLAFNHTKKMTQVTNDKNKTKHHNSLRFECQSNQINEKYFRMNFKCSLKTWISILFFAFGLK